MTSDVDPKLPTPEAIAAHHEAAHAVVAIELGLGILDVGIDLARMERTGGIGGDGCRLFLTDLTDVSADALAGEQERLAAHIDVNGTILAAGPASDAKLRQEDPWAALQKQHSDLAMMLQLLRQARLNETGEAVEARLRTQVDLAVDALEDPAVWAAVEAVAAAVLRQGALCGGDIEAIATPLLSGPS